MIDYLKRKGEMITDNIRVEYRDRVHLTRAHWMKGNSVRHSWMLMVCMIQLLFAQIMDLLAEDGETFVRHYRGLYKQHHIHVVGRKRVHNYNTHVTV